MLYAGLDLSRKRLDVHVLRDDGMTALVTAVAPNASALRKLVRRIAAEGGPVRAAIESMNGSCPSCSRGFPPVRLDAPARPQRPGNRLAGSLRPWWTSSRRRNLPGASL